MSGRVLRFYFFLLEFWMLIVHHSSLFSLLFLLNDFVLHLCNLKNSAILNISTSLIFPLPFTPSPVSSSFHLTVLYLSRSPRASCVIFSFYLPRRSTIVVCARWQDIPRVEIGAHLFSCCYHPIALMLSPHPTLPLITTSSFHLLSPTLKIILGSILCRN